MRRSIEITLPSPRRLAWALFATIGFLIALHALGPLLSPSGGRIPGEPPRLLALHAEGSFATLFSTALAAAASLMLAFLAVAARETGDRDAGRWAVLAAAFAWIAMDESVGFHEQVGLTLARYVDTGGPFHYAWVIPALVVVIVMAAAYAGFVGRLPPRARAGFALAGAVYVSAALGLEMVGGVVVERVGEEDPRHWDLAAVEEVLEMVGLVLFLASVVALARERIGAVSLRFAGRAPVRSAQEPEPISDTRASVKE